MLQAHLENTVTRVVQGLSRESSELLKQTQQRVSQKTDKRLHLQQSRKKTQKPKTYSLTHFS